MLKHYQFIWDMAEHNLILIHYCPTSDKPADMLMKALLVPQLTHLCHSIRLCPG